MAPELLIHQYVIALFSKMHGAVLMLGQDVAVSSVFNHEPHYISIPSFTSLYGKGEGGRIESNDKSDRIEHNVRIGRNCRSELKSKISYNSEI